MSYQLNFQAESFLAGEDLSSDMQKLVCLDTTAGTVKKPAAVGQYAEGVLENEPTINMPATVSYMGVTKVIVDAAYSIGQILMAKYDGTTGDGYATSATSTPALARLKALEASSASGDIIAVRFLDGGVTGIMG